MRKVWAKKQNSRLTSMNYLSLDKDTLYFHGFPKLQDKVAILYTAENSPAIITNGENRPSITCFEISERKCSSPQIIEYFTKKGSINHLFLEVGEQYIQSPICSPAISNLSK